MIRCEDRWSLGQDRVLNLNAGIRDIQRGIVPILPTHSSHEVLIRLLQEVEKGLRGHVLPQNTLEKWDKFLN